MFSDDFHIEFVGSEFVEDAIVGLAIDPPKPRAAYVSDARAELNAEQIEYSEDGVGLTGGVSHDLGEIELGFLF
jgi:hypothetical protein